MNLIRRDETGEYYSMNIKRGQSFDLQLSETAGTGYSWKIDHTPGLQLLDEKVILQNMVPGGSGTQVWTFRATMPGNQQITAVYRRPWEHTVERPNVYFVKVT